MLSSPLRLVCGVCLFVVWCQTGACFATDMPTDKLGGLPDLALQPPQVLYEIPAEYARSARGSQGVPSLERSASGRLWAAWYAGRSPRGVESPSSYVVVASSADEGVSWVERFVIVAQRRVHTYDPCLWFDPEGRLWCFWAQSAGLQDGRMGVWAITTDEADSESPQWTSPRRLFHGVMLNKPTVLKNGDWLLCSGLWRDSTNVPNISLSAAQLQPYTAEMLSHDLGDERGSNVFRSTDRGATFERIGQVRAPGTRPDEHMIVERKDGSLWMLIRNTGGIAQSSSTDGGRTWTESSLYLAGRTYASKRFFIRRLPSGALLFVRNNAPDGSRTHMTALISDDDGLTWNSSLLLDERESSYPDGTLTSQGTIYVIYDHQRYTLNRAGQAGVGAVMLAKFHEADVRAGKVISPDTRLQQVITQLREKPEN